RLLAAQARWVIVTDGAATLHWYTRQTQGKVTSFRVATVDTTAAGDAFVGGVLVGLLQRGGAGAGFAAFCQDPQAIDATLRFGAAVGALAVTRKGAFAAMPSLDEVQQLLQTQDIPA
ncbi:MAG: PfkB family carbohydrate kinase, partial [Stenotrophomonas sp.]